MCLPPDRLTASDIMEPNLTYVYPHTRVQSLVSILRTTAYHAFPVVTENRPNERDFMKGNILVSNNIRFKVRALGSSPWSFVAVAILDPFESLVMKTNCCIRGEVLTDRFEHICAESLKGTNPLYAEKLLLYSTRREIVDCRYANIFIVFITHLQSGE